ncbi:hypothetical protein Tco_1318757 [Tanacetum coccineum]
MWSWPVSITNAARTDRLGLPGVSVHRGPVVPQIHGLSHYLSRSRFNDEGTDEAKLNLVTDRCSRQLVRETSHLYRSHQLAPDAVVYSNA